MKKTIQILTVGLLTLPLLLSSCDKGSPVCEETKKTSAIVFDFPDSVSTSETFDLEVKYVLDNSCGEFDSFEIVSDDNETQVTLYAMYEGCNCNLEFEERSQTYPIQIPQEGFYQYSFWVDEDVWESYSLKVYE